MRPPTTLRGILALVSVLALGASACAGSSSSGGGSHTLTIWGIASLGTAPAGSPPKQWFDAQVADFTKQNPGWSVQLTELNISSMDVLIAKLDAAATSHTLPDIIDDYAGGYITVIAPVLLPLNKYITPDFYNSMSNWDLECTNFDCQGGKGVILGVPLNYYSYMLYYNKALFAKAGISSPPTTYDELYTDCAQLKDHGILPFVYGDRDGYTTDNLLNVNAGSYLEQGDMARLAAGTMHFADPKVVNALSAVVKLRQLGCVSADASTHEQADQTAAFTSGKGAMVEIYPGLDATFAQGIGANNLGTAPLPQSGSGSFTGKGVASPADSWVITRDSSHADVAWSWIKMVSATAPGISQNTLLGNVAANKQAAQQISDPAVLTMANYASNAPVPNMDIAMPIKVALLLYKECQLAFAGIDTPLQAMQAVDQAFAANS